jgi:hypothetical protein
VQLQRLALAARGEQAANGLELMVQRRRAVRQRAEARVLVQAPDVILELLDAAVERVDAKVRVVFHPSHLSPRG